MERLVDVLRFLRPYMLVASAVSFAIAGLFGGPFHVFGGELWVPERLLLAFGWAAWAGCLFVIASIVKEHT